MKTIRRLTSYLVTAAGLGLLAMTAQADPIGPGDTISDGDTLTTTIYGDAREGNPGDLAVTVVITFELNDDEEWVSHWNVAIAPGTLSDYSGDPLRIQAFGFNLNYDGAVAISNISPALWDANTGGDTVVGTGSGSGNTAVEILFCNDNGQPNPFSCSGNTTNAFAFDLMLEGGVAFDPSIFFGADEFDGDYIYDPGTGQMAAHIIGFEDDCSGAVGGMFDSRQNNGGAVGDGVGECGSVSVPEPGTLSLLGIGMLGLALARRRRKSA